VSVSGTNNFPGTPKNLAYITLFDPSGPIGHANVSWLAPAKVGQILVGGSKKMIIYDDLEPSEKIKVWTRSEPRIPRRRDFPFPPPADVLHVNRLYSRRT
jgi:hypothetical protein